VNLSPFAAKTAERNADKLLQEYETRNAPDRTRRAGRSSALAAPGRAALDRGAGFPEGLMQAESSVGQSRPAPAAAPRRVGGLVPGAEVSRSSRSRGWRCMPFARGARRPRAVGQPDESFAPVAVWPHATQDVTYLALPARQALSEQLGCSAGGGACRPASAASRAASSSPIARHPRGRHGRVRVVDLGVGRRPAGSGPCRPCTGVPAGCRAASRARRPDALAASLERARLATDAVAIVGETANAQAR